jgi:hypothetical protein
VSALSRKIRGDLRRHWGKNLLIVGTLALAIASFAIVAVPGLLNAAMQSQVRQARLYDVAVQTRDLDLSSRQLAALGHLPNVAAFEPAVEYSTVVASSVNGSRQNAMLWGVNVSHQTVDVVDVTGERLPGALCATSSSRCAEQADRESPLRARYSGGLQRAVRVPALNAGPTGTSRRSVLRTGCRQPSPSSKPNRASRLASRASRRHRGRRP